MISRRFQDTGGDIYCSYKKYPHKTPWLVINELYLVEYKLWNSHFELQIQHISCLLGDPQLGDSHRNEK